MARRDAKGDNAAITSAIEDKPHYAGHRKRLRARFLASAGDGLADYELLELILAQAIPRVDTKPLAKQLIQRFGGFAEVINAEPSALSKIDGIGDAAVTALKIWTLLTKVETSCDRILIAGGANVEAEWEQGPAV